MTVELADALCRLRLIRYHERCTDYQIEYQRVFKIRTRDSSSRRDCWYVRVEAMVVYQKRASQQYCCSVYQDDLRKIRSVLVNIFAQE